MRFRLPLLAGIPSLNEWLFQTVPLTWFVAQDKSKECRQAAQHFPIGQWLRTEPVSFCASPILLTQPGRSWAPRRWYSGTGAFQGCLLINPGRMRVIWPHFLIALFKMWSTFFSLSSAKSSNRHFPEIENVYWSWY